MSTSFDPKGSLIRLPKVELEGPTGVIVVPVMALDTGSTFTAINEALLVGLGYDPSASKNRLNITTGAGLVSVPRLTVMRLKALGQERTNFPVLAHNFPPTATVDGLLGLDFIRDLTLTIDFRTGQITLI